MIKILKQCPAFIAATQNTLIKVAMNSSIVYLEFHNYCKKSERNNGIRCNDSYTNGGWSVIVSYQVSDQDGNT